MVLWSEIVGVTARAKKLPVDGRNEALPGGFGHAFSDGMKFLSDFGLGTLLLRGDVSCICRMSLELLTQCRLVDRSQCDAHKCPRVYGG